MNLNPLVILLVRTISLFEMMLIASTIISWLVYFNIINKNQPLVRRITYAMDRLIEPVLDQIRRIIPSIGGIDLAVIILFLLLSFVKDILLTYFYQV